MQIHEQADRPMAFVRATKAELQTALALAPDSPEWEALWAGDREQPLAHGSKLWHQGYSTYVVYNHNDRKALRKDLKVLANRSEGER